MVFKRRTPLGVWDRLKEFVWPKRGWGRSISYILHRVRRLPDPPHRVARGVAAGIFVCFTPFYGFHFVLAGILAFLLRGNILAALLATFFGNPLTFPIIASVSVELGSWMLGLDRALPLYSIVAAFSGATLELWANIAAIFTSAPTRWERIWDLLDKVFWPYLIGGLIPGAIAGIVSYMLTHRVVEAYQRRRMRKLKARVERRRALEAARVARAAAAAQAEAEAMAEGDTPGESETKHRAG